MTYGTKLFLVVLSTVGIIGILVFAGFTFWQKERPMPEVQSPPSSLPRPEPVPQPTQTPPVQPAPQSTTTSDVHPFSLSATTWRTYRSEEYGFEVRYPAAYTLTEPGLSGPAKSGWKLFRSTDDYLKGDWLDFRFYLMPHDSEDGRHWITSFEEEGAEYVSSSESFTLGQKELRRRKESGVTGSEQILWLEPRGKFIVLFAISPLRSEFTQEAYGIIESFRFVK